MSEPVLVTCRCCDAEFEHDIEPAHSCSALEAYRVRIDEQTQRWLGGKPVHNDVDGECCPDFSCCQPELLAPIETREAFVRANEDARMSMLMSFLGAGLAAAVPEKTVYIAGDPANREVPS